MEDCVHPTGTPTPPLNVKWHEKWKRWVIVGTNGKLYPSIFRAMAWQVEEHARGFLTGIQNAERVP